MKVSTKATNKATNSEPKQMPQSIEAEQSTLGAMMMERDAITRAIELLQTDDFYRELHRTIFNAIKTLTEQNEPVDLITLVEHLRSDERLAEIGGAAYLASLVDGCPSAANIEAYANIVKEKSHRRATIHAAEQVKEIAFSDAHISDLAEPLALLEKAAESVFTSKTPRFILQSLEEVEKPVALRWLIEDVLQPNTLSALVGMYGCFKSFIALSIALSVATGKAWNGHKAEQGAVVYIAAEGAAELGRRTRAFRIRHVIERPENFHVLPQSMQFGKLDEVEVLIAQLRTLPQMPALIVVDTLARCAVGIDENSAREMGLVVAAADRLREATGAHVMLVHHTGKDGSIRGSTALPGALSTLIEVERRGDDVTLRCAKQKDAAEFEPISLIKRVVELGDSTASLIFDPTTSEETPQPQTHLSLNEQEALTLLEQHLPTGGTSAQWWNTCKQQGMTKPTFFRVRNALVKVGCVSERHNLYFAGLAVSPLKGRETDETETEQVSKVLRDQNETARPDNETALCEFQNDVEQGFTSACVSEPEFEGGEI